MRYDVDMIYAWNVENVIQVGYVQNVKSAIDLLAHCYISYI